MLLGRDMGFAVSYSVLSSILLRASAGGSSGNDTRISV